jgi:hypothetical protein
MTRVTLGGFGQDRFPLQAGIAGVSCFFELGCGNLLVLGNMQPLMQLALMLAESFLHSFALGCGLLRWHGASLIGFRSKRIVSLTV